MTPKMAIKTILLTTKAPKAEHRKKKSSLVYYIRPEICKDVIL